MLLTEAFSPILCSLKYIIVKVNLIKLNKLERESCLFQDAILKLRIPKWFSFALRALISLILKYFELIRM